MATKGHTRILLRGVEVVIFIFIFVTVRVNQGEILLRRSGTGRGLRGRGRLRAEETVAPGIGCLRGLGFLALDEGCREDG
jgi:hypothetical protein